MPAHKPRRNYTWAELMRRVWGFEVLECERCGGSMKLVAAVVRPSSIKRILTALGLPGDPPAVAPARAPPEQLDWVC